MADQSSIAVTLSQAVAVRDDAALSTCLEMQDAAIIDNSVAKLSAAHAVALLELLVERLQHHPQQAARLAPWLRSLLLAHGPALATAPAGQASLQHAHQLLEERTSSFNSLLNLSGRLQVLQPAKGGSGTGVGAAPTAAAKVVYNA